jgi:hypothetical protein
MSKTFLEKDMDAEMAEMEDENEEEEGGSDDEKMEGEEESSEDDNEEEDEEDPAVQEKVPQAHYHIFAMSIPIGLTFEC